jgi:hypothetical protein
MKKSIKWHEECQKNKENYYIAIIIKAQSELVKAQQALLRNEFYKQQIEEAKKLNMSEFDRKRLLVKRKAKVKE